VLIYLKPLIRFCRHWFFKDSSRSIKRDQLLWAGKMQTPDVQLVFGVAPEQ